MHGVHQRCWINSFHCNTLRGRSCHRFSDASQEDFIKVLFYILVSHQVKTRWSLLVGIDFKHTMLVLLSTYASLTFHRCVVRVDVVTL